MTTPERDVAAILRATLHELEIEHGHSSDHEAVWPVCARRHAVMDRARAALAAPLSSPVEPPPGLDGPIGVEERVELARAMGRMQAEQEAVQAIGRIVMAAGGEVRVPDNLLVRDVTVDSDFVNGTTIYRARLLPTQASDSKEPKETP